MKKLAIVAAGIAAIPLLAMSAPVFADSPGQLMGGTALYEVKNITTGSSYAASTSATCNDTVQYSIEVHNTEYGKLSNVMVKSSLPSTTATSNMSTVTASATNSANQNVSVNGSVTVNLSQAAAINYVNGSTKLYDGSGKLVKTLDDGITAGGLNLGDLAGSTGEFVNFQGKVTCQATPPQTCQPGQTGTYPNCTTPTCQSGQTGTYPNCVTPATPTTPTTPTTLPNTGAGNVVGIVAGVVVAGFVASRLYLSRKLARKN